MWIVWLTACREADEPATECSASAAQGVVGPSLGAPGPGVHLAAELSLSTEAPTSLALTVAGTEGTRAITFPELTTEHRVPLLGLRADSEYTVAATLTGPDGVAVDGGRCVVRTGAGPSPMPDLAVLAHDPAQMEPGYTLMPLARPDVGWIVALDAALEVVYAASASPKLYGVTPTPQGDLAMIDGHALRVRDMLGRTVRRWTAEPVGPQDVAVPFDMLHHDVRPQPDGSVFTLAHEVAEVASYPRSYDLGSFGPATIANDVVVHLAPDGAVLGRWDMVSLLDLHHIGFDALEPDPAGASGALGWTHANAVLYDAEADEITVSLRHQDAVVRFSADSGELRWIFAPPEGWAAAFQPALLQPTAPFVWPTHQHAVELQPDPGDGEGLILRLFDNGNDLRSTPYRSSGQQVPYSRVFEARIDPVAMTVAPLGSFEDTATGREYSPWVGNADGLPTTGNRLATYGLVPRIVEWEPGGDPVLDVVFEPGDWYLDRALRVPSLYGPGVVERWIR
jgi:arylsulfate sulfotransferase